MLYFVTSKTNNKHTDINIIQYNYKASITYITYITQITCMNRTRISIALRPIYGVETT